MFRIDASRTCLRANHLNSWRSDPVAAAGRPHDASLLLCRGDRGWADVAPVDDCAEHGAIIAEARSRLIIVDPLDAFCHSSIVRP